METAAKQSMNGPFHRSTADSKFQRTMATNVQKCLYYTCNESQSELVDTFCRIQIVDEATTHSFLLDIKTAIGQHLYLQTEWLNIDLCGRVISTELQ